MKRNEFIKNLALTMGGTTLLACETDLITNLLPTSKLQSIEVDEAKNFFEKDYMKKFPGLRIAKENHHNRRADWNKAFKEKKTKKNDNDNDQEFVVVPVEYDENKFPAIMMYTDETKYLAQLPRAGSLPIKEYLIVYKNKNKNEAFLAQVCAHPSDNTTVVNNFVDMNTFTGMLIKADWEDKPASGYKYVKGKLTQYFDTGISTNAKLNDCFMTYYGYQTVTIQPCSGNYGVSYSGGCLQAVYTYYTQVNWICTNYATYDPYSPYFYYPSYSPAWQSGSGATSPLLNTTAYPNNSAGYNACRAINNVGNDKQYLSNILNHTSSALGLGTGLTGLNMDIAQALAKSIGGDMTMFNKVTTAGKITSMGWRSGIVGGIGIATGGVQFVLGLAEDGWQGTMDKDLGNLVGLTLGIGALYIEAPVILIGIGVVSLGLGVYQASCN